MGKKPNKTKPQPDPRTALRSLSVSSRRPTPPPSPPEDEGRGGKKEAPRKPQRPTADGAGGERGGGATEPSPPFPSAPAFPCERPRLSLPPLLAGRGADMAVRKVTWLVASCGQAGMADETPIFLRVPLLLGAAFLGDFCSPAGLPASALRGAASCLSPPERCSHVDSPVSRDLSTRQGENPQGKVSPRGGGGGINIL